MRALILLAGIAAAGCTDMPRDPAGTRDRIETEGRLIVGTTDGDLHPKAEAFVRRIATAAGARPTLVRGGQEDLLLALDEGRIHLVIAALAQDSPWAPRVAIVAPPLHDGGRSAIVAVARGGENDWLSLLEREARNAEAAQ